MRRPAAVACLAALIACSPPASRARDPQTENPPKVQPAVSHPVADGELVDTDHDDVPDVCDWCPREPGINRVDHPFGRGCPYVDCFGGSDDLSISFARNQTDPPAQLEVVAHQLEVSSRIVIVGHASADEKDPERISEERAQKVMNRLVSGGIDASQLEAHGAGADVSTSGASAWRVDLVQAHWCQRTRAWDPVSRDVHAAPRGELSSCLQRLRL